MISNHQASKSKLQSLYNQKEFSDVEFVVAEKTFYAWRGLIAAWSEPLKTMLFGSFAESSSKRIVLEDVDPTAFEMFLRTVYYGDTGEKSQPFHNFIPLFVFAHKYEIEELKDSCLELLNDNITVENACILLQTVDKYSFIEEMEASGEN
jgi:hypothetical protein